ncbi:MAG: STAS/SEC14 domain-containing protein [Thiolinea sp.]
MLAVQIDEANGIALFEPHSALSEEDFKVATQAVDAYIEQHEKLKGVIIHTKLFPGWNSFSGLMAHLKFVRDHHKKVSYVAIATDSSLGDMAEMIASHFVSAEIKQFAYDEQDQARQWIEEQA